MSMDESQAAQPTLPRTQPTPIRKLGARGTADHHVLDVAASIQEYTDLTSNLPGDLGQRAGELVCDDAVRFEASATESFEGLDLARLEAAGVAVDLDRDGLGSNARERGTRRGKRAPREGREGGCERTDGGLESEA